MALTLATFNVKNLLHPADEAGRAVLAEKLEWLARMIRACDADVLGLQEVGPPALLAALLAKVRSAGGGGAYGEPVLGTADARGIRCALVSRVPVADARVHTAASLAFPVFVEGDPAPFGSRVPLRRGVVHARVEAPGWGPVHVLVAHFKSPRPVPLRGAASDVVEPRTARERAEGVLRSLVWRAAEALHVRGIVDAIVTTAAAADGAARVAVLGDLNDVPDSPVVSAVRGSGDGILLDCATAVPEARRFSAMHDGRRTQIDHVLATASLYAHLVRARFLNDELREHTWREDEGEAPTVDSDHAPLVACFE
jgi:endonuclease/exonuclease/phosphatase family metal-dependent hydrolase